MNANERTRTVSMRKRGGPTFRRLTAATGGVALVLLVLVAAGSVGAAAASPPTAVPHGAPGPHSGTVTLRAAVPLGGIRHVMVIDLENESFSSIFGGDSPATYLNHTLVPQGELLSNYHATGHVSADNYLAQVSGQAPNLVTDSDCITNLSTEAGSYNDVTPGTLDPNQVTYPGQVDGQGCVYPSAVQTIGSQLDPLARGTTPSWREYAEDMGNLPARDGGTPDPLGGTDCAHPVQSGGAAVDGTNNAAGPNATGSQVLSAISDQYVDRHNPFVYFHSATDNPAYCAAHIVPLGTMTMGATGGADSYHGHLAQDLSTEATTAVRSPLATPASSGRPAPRVSTDW